MLSFLQDMDKTHLRSAIMEEIMSFHQPKQTALSFNAFLRPAPKHQEPKVEKTDTFSEDALKSPKLTEEMGKPV